MPLYKDLNSDSGVSSYELGDDSITVHFKRGGSYIYTCASAGSHHIAEMKRLALAGDGLNSYIQKFVRKGYLKKLR